MILFPAREKRILTDSLTIPGYVVTLARCFWTHQIWESPHFRVQVCRANGIALYVDTLPAGMSEERARWVAVNHLRMTAALDLLQNERRQNAA